MYAGYFSGQSVGCMTVMCNSCTNLNCVERKEEQSTKGKHIQTDAQIWIYKNQSNKTDL